MTTTQLITRYKTSVLAPWRTLSSGGDLDYHKRTAEGHRTRFPSEIVDIVTQETTEKVMWRDGHDVIPSDAD